MTRNANPERAERTRGLYRLLGLSWVYNLSQKAFGIAQVRKALVYEHIGPKQGMRILDIGCGTAELAHWLPECDYQGFDPNPSYVAAAQAHLDDGERVWLGSIDKPNIDRAEKFDVVVGSGVLHHVPDAVAQKFFALASHHLKDDGRLLTMDPCTYDGQSWVARQLVLRDRGPWVRRPDEYETLANPWFGRVEGAIHSDLLRIPYTHFIMVSSAPTR